MKSFVRSETSADQKERDFLFAQRENNNNKKARKKGRYSREKRGVLREINRIFKSLSKPLLSVFSWRGGFRRSRRRFFCSKFEKKTLEKAFEKRAKKEREKEISSPTRRKTTPRQQNSDKSRSIRLSRIIFVSRIRRL